MDPERFRASKPAYGENYRNDLSNLPTPPPPQFTPKNAKKGSKWWLWLLIVFVLIILVGLGAWAYSSYNTKPTPKKTVQQHQTTAPKKVASAPAPPPVPTTSYTSTNFNTSFNYPTGWNLVDSGSAPLTVTSPAMNIVADNGQSVLGQIVLTLANKGVMPSGFTTQSVAVLNSQKISFTSPSTSQAAQSYVSFVQYPTTTITGGLDGIFLTGNYGYQKDQNIPSSNVAAVDPLVYISFYSCSSQQCPIASRKPLTISSKDWGDSSFQGPLLDTLESFTFH